MPIVRRARGAILRLVRRRGLSAIIGAALALPSAWVQFSDGDFAWWMRGLALVCGAIGVAFLYTGLVGLGPDWVEPPEL